jgi:hypothetical protein
VAYAELNLVSRECNLPHYVALTQEVRERIWVEGVLRECFAVDGRPCNATQCTGIGS